MYNLIDKHIIVFFSSYSIAQVESLRWNPLRNLYFSTIQIARKEKKGGGDLQTTLTKPSIDFSLLSIVAST